MTEISYGSEEKRLGKNGIFPGKTIGHLIIINSTPLTQICSDIDTKIIY